MVFCFFLSRLFFESFKHQGRDRRYYLSLGLSVLQGGFHCDPQTLPTTSCFGNVITIAFGDRPRGLILGAWADISRPFPLVAWFRPLMNLGSEGSCTQASSEPKAQKSQLLSCLLTFSVPPELWGNEDRWGKGRGHANETQSLTFFRELFQNPGLSAYLNLSGCPLPCDTE